MEILASISGSDANFHCFSDGFTTIAIDCGISIEKMNKAINYKLSSISAFLITHEHSDHTKYIDKVLDRAVPCYMARECLQKLSLTSYYAKCIKHDKQPTGFDIGTFKIKPFELPHNNADGTDCFNLGYLIYSKVTHERLLFCTDCLCIPYTFPPCEYYFIECNYSKIDDFLSEIEFINTAVEHRRVFAHMSLQTCIEFLEKQNLSKCKEIRPIHISKNSVQNAKEFNEIIQDTFMVKRRSNNGNSKQSFKGIYCFQTQDI